MSNKCTGFGVFLQTGARHARAKWWWLPLFCLLCRPATAQNKTLEEPITLQLPQGNGTELLDKLDAQTNFSFTFSKNAFRELSIGKITWENTALGKALEELKERYGIEYQVVNTTISFRLRQLAPEPAAKDTSVRPKTGRVTGRVVDFENGDPLIGASVSIEEGEASTISDSTGHYELKGLPVGTYTLQVSYVGYASSRIQHLRIGPDATTNFDVKLQVKAAGAGVVVTGIRRKAVANTTDEQLVSEMYHAQTVVSGISNEQIARSLDRDAAEVVKRVPGVNISEDNYVIVRGLNKRYNLTFLNDAMAPATDADSRAFSYDVINSNAIDRIMVYKSPSPDLPGEFSGGLVKIYTKKSQLTRQFDVQLSAQYRSGSSFENLLNYAGSKTDFLGFDDGLRALPEGIPRAATFNHLTDAENARYSSQFRNIYLVDKDYKVGPDLRFNLNYYDAWKIGNKYLKNLTSVAYSNTHEQRISEQNSLYKHHDGQITQGIHSARISVIQSNEIKLSEAFSLELRNFFNINNQRVAVEDYKRLDDYPSSELRHNNLYYVENMLYSAQLGSNWVFGKAGRSTLKTNISYSTIHKQEPDNRDYTLTRALTPAGKDQPDEENPWQLVNHVISYYTLSRMFTDLREQTYQGNADFHHQFTEKLGFKAGVYHETRVRDFGSRTFMLTNGANMYDPNLAIIASEYSSDNGPLPGGAITIREKYLQHYFDPSMFREDGTGYRWVEKTTPNNQYYADNMLTAGYLSADLRLLNNQLNIFGGLRVEDNNFRILGSHEYGLATYPLEVNQHITSFLPSVNVSYRPDSAFIIRVSYGKTLNRPEFREAAPMVFKNYIDQETYTGNPELTTVDIHNMELRLEWYPNSFRRNEMVNVGFFYKSLDRPIERFRMIFSEGFDQFFYTNTGKAKVYGIEAELRKSFDFIPGTFFRNFSALLNGSWFKSNVDVPGMTGRTGYRGSRSRPLQGQSPYLLNASLNYEDAGAGTRISLSYNRAGEYIYAVGANKGESADADIMTHGRDQLDLTWRQRINSTFSVNAGVQNLLNAPVLFYQDTKNNYRYDAPNGTYNPNGGGEVYDKSDIIFRKYYLRPYFSLAVNMIF